MRPSVVWKLIGITVTYIQISKKVLDFKDLAVTMWNQNLWIGSLKLLSPTSKLNLAKLITYFGFREDNENVILLPDQFGITEFLGNEKNLRGSWMLLPSFTEQLVFDLRSEPTRAIRQ